jgi:hypothetical protein
MVKIRTLVPLTHPSTGELFAAGVEVDVADDVAADWRADGKVSMLADEQKEQAPGNYTARTTREDVGSVEPEERAAPREKKK